MKLETHLHTKEGSIDSIVSVVETVEKLKEKGYEGMIVTDHNSYDGFNEVKDHYIKDFVIIKGIEYDTSDGGHMLIILPSNTKNADIFTHKGMKIKDTVEVVKSLGGIIGPAHPFDYYKLGLMNNAKWFKNADIIKEFDFVESFNACGSLVGNSKSKALAKVYNKPTFGGSDSHKHASVGLAHTILPEYVNNEDELISLVKRMQYGDTIVDGEYYKGKTSDKLGVIYDIGVKTFYGIGRASSLYTRRKALKKAMALSLI